MASLILSYVPLFTLCLLAVMLFSGALSEPTEEFETVRTSNAAILNRLGLVPMVLSDGHHRKRLAGPESAASRGNSRIQQPPLGRRHAGSGQDSHVYVVKLPASPPYYSFSKPHKADANVSISHPNPGFRNNGKPAKIYHWNLPLLKKLNEKKKQVALLKVEQARRKMEAERERQKLADKMNFLKKLAQEQLLAQGQSKPSRNNDKWLSQPEKAEPRINNTGNATHLKILTSAIASSADKIYRLNDYQVEQQSMSRHAPGRDQLSEWQGSAGNDVDESSRNSLEGSRPKKHKKKSAVSYYYAPPLTGKSASTSISKHFAGNGKPKAFYVMEKSRKPIYYHPLLP